MRLWQPLRLRNSLQEWVSGVWDSKASSSLGSGGRVRAGCRKGAGWRVRAGCRKGAGWREVAAAQVAVGSTGEVCSCRSRRGGSRGTERLGGVAGAPEPGAGALEVSPACDSGPVDFGTIPAIRKNMIATYIHTPTRGVIGKGETTHNM